LSFHSKSRREWKFSRRHGLYVEEKTDIRNAEFE